MTPSSAGRGKALLLTLLVATPFVDTALSRLATLAATQIAEHSAQGPVAIEVAGPSTELAHAFSTLLASELALRKLGPIVLEPSGERLVEEVARRSGARSLVRLRVAVEHGTLKARGDLFSTWVNFWSGRAQTRAPFPAAAIYASTEADAQALALAAQPPGQGEANSLTLVGATLARLALSPAALATGDINGDGVDEVLVLTDEEVLALDLNGRVLARREHKGLPPSPTPCREPFGTVTFLKGPPPRVAYFSAQREKGELLELDRAGGTFRPLATIDEVPLGEIAGKMQSGHFTPGQNTVVWQGPSTELRTGLGEAQPPLPLSSLSIFETESGFHLLLVFPNGSASWTKMQGKVSSSFRLDRLGTGSALVDLDGDGMPELVTSSVRYLPRPDELRVLRQSSATGEAVSVPRGRVLQVAAVRLKAQFNGRVEMGVVVGISLPDGTGEIQLFTRGNP